jgi:hypothetical protein
LPQTQTQRFGPANLHWKKNEAYVTSHNVKKDSFCEENISQVRFYMLHSK